MGGGIPWIHLTFLAQGRAEDGTGRGTTAAGCETPSSIHGPSAFLGAVNGYGWLPSATACIHLPTTPDCR